MIKFVLLALLMVVVAWLWALVRRASKPPVPPTKADEPAVMVVCAHCGVHLPRADALPGPGGVYCSEAHRAAGRAPR